MAKLNLSSLSTLVRDKRGSKGLREASKEIGISSATLSRIENGKLPDLETFSMICNWLEIDPNEILGCKTGTVENAPEDQMVYAHMRADKNLTQEAIQSMTEMILRARDMMSNKA